MYLHIPGCRRAQDYSDKTSQTLNTGGTRVFLFCSSQTSNQLFFFFFLLLTKQTQKISLNVTPLTNLISTDFYSAKLSVLYPPLERTHAVIFNTVAINLHFWHCSGGLNSRVHSRTHTVVS